MRSFRRLPIILIFSLVFAAALIGFSSWLEDGLMGSFIAVMFDADTQYSQDYSYNAFTKIKVGDDGSLVGLSLGQPLSTWQYKQHKNLVFVSVFSEPAGELGHYRQRDIHISNGRVLMKVSGVFVD